MTEKYQRREEVVIDQEISQKSQDNAMAAAQLSAAIDSLHYGADDKQERRRFGRGYIRVWGMNAIAAHAAVVAIAGDEAQPGWKRREATDKLARYDVKVEAVKATSMALFEAEQKYLGWSRFYLVTNTGGHIHSSTSCSTCYPSTQYNWLTDLSGLTEKEAVDGYGPRICSVCYPSAPVEWTVGIPVAAGCVGSGKPVASGRSRYFSCPDCGKYVAVTRYGLLRKHEPAVSKSPNA